MMHDVTLTLVLELRWYKSKAGQTQEEESHFSHGSSPERRPPPESCLKGRTVVRTHAHGAPQPFVITGLKEQWGEEGERGNRAHEQDRRHTSTTHCVAAAAAANSVYAIDSDNCIIIIMVTDYYYYYTVLCTLNDTFLSFPHRG